MREFQSTGRFMLQRGRVIMVRLDREEERDGLCKRLQAEGIKVDGQEVTLIAIESWALSTLGAGTEIGLLIKEPLR